MKPTYEWEDPEFEDTRFDLYEVTLSSNKKQYLLVWIDDEIGIERIDGTGDSPFLAVEEARKNGHDQLYRFWVDFSSQFPELIGENEKELIDIKVKYWKELDRYLTKRMNQDRLEW
jgi:hypothetical protein